MTTTRRAKKKKSRAQNYPVDRRERPTCEALEKARRALIYERQIEASGKIDYANLDSVLPPSDEEIRQYIRVMAERATLRPKPKRSS